jgi:outer membrane protein OmpA-like peptidoglycan-associated protein
MKKFLIIFLLFSTVFVFGQKKLRIGEKIPLTSLSVFNKDDKKTVIDLPNGKNLSDKFVLVLFFNTQQPVKHLVDINQKLEQTLNRFQNNACKGASEIEYITICAEEKPEVWKKYLDDGNLNASKFNGKKTNYLAKKGMKDEVLKAFCVDKFPSYFLVNPKGRLWLETDTAAALDEAFRSICRTNPNASTADIAGKVLIGEKEKTPLIQHLVYLLNHKEDTITSTKTDAYGDFTFSKVDTSQALTIRVAPTEKIKNNPVIFLAKLTGEIITEIKKTIKGDFEYKLLKADVVLLSPIEDEDDITLKYKKFDRSGQKSLLTSQNIYYESGKFNITFEGELVLDKVIVILNANSAVKLDIISHTDARGDDATNLALSQKRSNAVVDYLVSKGIDKGRLKAVGKGESAIKNRCLNGIECSDKEQEFNRRTEFNFIKN